MNARNYGTEPFSRLFRSEQRPHIALASVNPSSAVEISRILNF